MISFSNAMMNAILDRGKKGRVGRVKGTKRIVMPDDVHFSQSGYLMLELLNHHARLNSTCIAHRNCSRENEIDDAPQGRLYA